MVSPSGDRVRPTSASAITAISVGTGDEAGLALHSAAIEEAAGEQISYGYQPESDGESIRAKGLIDGSNLSPPLPVGSGFPGTSRLRAGSTFFTGDAQISRGTSPVASARVPGHRLFSIASGAYPDHQQQQQPYQQQPPQQQQQERQEEGPGNQQLHPQGPTGDMQSLLLAVPVPRSRAGTLSDSANSSGENGAWARSIDTAAPIQWSSTPATAESASLPLQRPHSTPAMHMLEDRAGAANPTAVPTGTLTIVSTG